MGKSQCVELNTEQHTQPGAELSAEGQGLSEEKVVHSFPRRKGPREHLTLWKSSGQFTTALSLDLQLNCRW